MKEKYLLANGLRLAYDEFGSADDPAIVLIMGLGAQMIAWPEVFCEQLAERGLRVIRFDNRDIGLSEKIDTKLSINLVKLMLRQRLNLPIAAPYCLRDMASDAIGLLDALEIDQAHWLGASMGGMIAQILAAEYPERTLSLNSIMSSSGNPKLPAADAKVLYQMMTRPHPSKEKEYIAHAVKTWGMIGSPDYPPKPDDLLARIKHSMQRSYSPRGYKHQMAAIMKTGDRRHLLRKINAPTMIIHGKQDRLVPAAASIDIAKHIKHARLHLIDGMGHDLPRELLPRFVDLIVNGLEQVTRAA